MSRYGAHDVWNRIPYLNYDLSGKLDFDASVSVPGTKIGNWQRLTLLEDKGKQREMGPKNCILPGHSRKTPMLTKTTMGFKNFWRYLAILATEGLFHPKYRRSLCWKSIGVIPRNFGHVAIPGLKSYTSTWVIYSNIFFSYPKVSNIPNSNRLRDLTVSFWEIGLCQGGEIGSDRTH